MGNMTVSQGNNFKHIRHNGREFRIIWEVLTLSAPEGARVIVTDFSLPRGKKVVFDKDGSESELEALKGEAEAKIQELAG